MDDDRIERALRAGPLAEPRYEPALGALIAAEGNLDGSEDGQRFAERVRRGRGAIAPRPGLRGLRLAGPIAAALVVALVAVSLRLALPPGPPLTPPPGDLLQRIRAAGAVRVAITSGFPQTTAAGGSSVGFDVEVAKALAEELGVRADVSILSSARILAGDEPWDIAFPSREAPGTTADVMSTVPYYGWPVWLVVAVDSTATSVSDLDGVRVCNVIGSAGLDWLAGRTSPGVTVSVEPPRRVPAVHLATETSCLEAIRVGEADGAVTAALLDDELPARGMRALSGGPVLVERRSVLVRGEASDVASLVVELDRLIEELRSTGRLAELSRTAFGGRDFSVVGR